MRKRERERGRTGKSENVQFAVEFYVRQRNGDTILSYECVHSA